MDVPKMLIPEPDPIPKSRPRLLVPDYITNQRQFRTAIGILVGVSLLSTLFGSLIMYCASFSKLLMISKLTTDSVQEERYITERLFEKINPSVECRKFCESGDICSDVCRGQINIKRLSFNLRLDLVF